MTSAQCSISFGLLNNSDIILKYPTLMTELQYASLKGDC